MNPKEENITPEEIEETPPKKKRWWRRLFIFFIFSVTAMLIILAGFIASFQIPGIRKIYSNTLSDILTDELEAKVEFSDLRVNGLINIELLNVRIITVGDTLLSTPSIFVDLSLMRSNLQNLYINKIAIKDPKIKLIRSSQDSSWNFEHIAKPAKKDKPPTPNPNLMINLGNLVLENAQLAVNDKLYSVKREIFNPFKNNLKDLNLSLNGKIDLLHNDFKVNLDNLSFTDLTSKTQLKSANAQIELNEKKVEVVNLTLVSKTSNLKLEAKADNLNIFKHIGDNEVHNMKLAVKIDSKNFNGEFLEYFAPMPTRFGEVDKVSLIASGKIDSLAITQMIVANNKSNVEFSAALYDVTKGEKINYAIEIRNSLIYKTDVAKFIPNADISYLPDINAINIKQLNGSGDIKSVKTVLELNSENGNAKGTADLDFSTKDLAYKADLMLENFDLSSFAKDSSLKTNITGHLVTDAKGTDPKNLNGYYNLKATNSVILSNEINILNIVLKAANNRINFDTLNIEFSAKGQTDEYIEKEKSLLAASGYLDFAAKEPKYDLKVDFHAIDFAKILRNKLAPEYASGSIKIDGESFDPDKIIGTVKSNFDIVLYGDRSILPFTFDANFSRDSTYKVFNFNSTFFDAKIEGKFSYASLFKSFADQADYLSDFFNKKYRTIYPDKLNTESVVLKELNNSAFDEIDCRITANIRDLSPISLFTNNIKIVNTSALDVEIKSDANSSNLKINKFEITNFGLETKDLKLSAFQTSILGDLNLTYQDEQRKFNSFNLKLQSERAIQINDLLIDKPNLSLNFDGNKIDFDSKAKIKNEFDIKLLGNANLVGNEIDLHLNKLNFAYADLAQVYNLDEIDIKISSDLINVRNFVVSNDSTEIITLSGNYYQNEEKFSNLKLVLENFDIKKILSKVNVSDVNLKTMQGNIKKATLLLNGTLADPDLTLDFQTGNLKFTGKNAGSLNGSIAHNDSLVTGLIKIESIDNKLLATNLEVKIISLPLNLGLKGVKNRIHSEEQFNIITSIKDLNLKLISPFIPEISNLSGLGNGSIFINGFAPDSVNYIGRVQVNNVSFLANASNINYLADGRLELVRDTLKFLNVELRNLQEDNPRSQADLSGYMSMKNFDFKRFDFIINAKNLLILSDASKLTMPNLYGKFKIATGREPLRFYGTFDRPNLTGSVDILDADIAMPMPDLSQNVTNSFDYRRKNITQTQQNIVDAKYATENNIAIEKEEKEFVANRSFNDLMNYEVDVRFPGKFKLEMGLPLYINTTTYIGTEDKNKTMRYEKPSGSKMMSLQGEISIFNNSTMFFLGKKLNLYGRISFPTGSIENPTLNMLANYKGKTKVDNLEKDYEVDVRITGTKKVPNLSFSYKIGNEIAQGDSNAIFQNIVYLFTFGKTDKELSKTGNIGQSNLMDESLNKGSSVLLSSTLNQFVTNFGFIKSADVDYQGGSLDNSRINLKGDIVGGLEWSVGGNLNNISNPEFVIDAPFSFWGLNNLILQYKYINNTNQTQTQDQIRWESKLKYGSSW